MERIACAVALTMALASCSTTPPPPPTPEARRSAEEKPDAPPLAPPPPSAPQEEAAPKPQTSAPPVKEEPDCQENPKWKAGEKADFPFFLLALSWAPSFCVDKPSKGQCQAMPGSFAATHLTLHGLWPNYEAEVLLPRGKEGPFFCPEYVACKKHPDREECKPGLDVIPKSLKDYGPGYLTDENFLANHEWPKHGSCTGQPPCEYMSTGIKAPKALPGDQGTPDFLTRNLGLEVTPKDLRAAFGQEDSVVLSCTDDCKLLQVGICLKNDDGRPGKRYKCPGSVTLSDYNNGCLNHCEKITISKPGNASASPEKSTSTEKTAKPEKQGKKEKSASSDKPKGKSGSGKTVKGPSCDDDDECTKAHYLRCAKSGYCTNVPL
jgi:ribonuclease T2